MKSLFFLSLLLLAGTACRAEKEYTADDVGDVLDSINVRGARMHPQQAGGLILGRRAVMARQQAEKQADPLTLLDYRITGLWVENQRLRARVDSLEARLSRAHIVAVRDSEYVKVDRFITDLAADTTFLPSIYQWERIPRYKISFDPEKK